MLVHPQGNQKRRPWVVYLVVMVLVCFGLYGPALRIFGVGANAKVTEVRRTGGSEPQFQHRYWWVIGYEFTAADGQQYSGHTRALAADSGPTAYKPIERVFYLSTFPGANVLAANAGPHAGTLAILGAAALILWLTAPRAGKSPRGRGWKGGVSAPRSQPVPAALPLTSPQTERWLRTYRGHARLYAWVFFLLMITLVLVVIWFETGVIDQDVLLSLAFFAVVFLSLVLWSRRGTSRAWQGIVAEKIVHVERVRRTGMPDETVERLMIEVEADGRCWTVRGFEALGDYFHKGDAVFKLAGFDWPEKMSLSGATRMCIVCGDLLEINATHCPRCTAPVPDHATLLRDVRMTVRSLGALGARRSDVAPKNDNRHSVNDCSSLHRTKSYTHEQGEQEQ